MSIKKITRNCELCGKPFSYWPSHQPNAKYCSMSCAKTRPNPAELFWTRVNKSPGQGPKGDCWQWKAGKSENTYGAFYWKGKQTGAHRVAYELTYGDIQDGLQVLHRCDNPPCCNPVHLFTGTNQDNMTDKVMKGRHPSGATHYTVIGKKSHSVSKEQPGDPKTARP